MFTVSCRFQALVASVVAVTQLISAYAAVSAPLAGKSAAAIFRSKDGDRFNAPLRSTVLVRRDPHVFNGKEM